jgi:uncharacterized damage-inducible protein DinB
MNHQTLLELIYGHGAHVDVVACATVPLALAGKRPEGFPHSVWQQVRHMTYWTEYELARIAGTPWPYPEHASESWPAEPAPASEQDWATALAGFKACLDRMAALVRAGDETLRRPVLPTAAQSKPAGSVEAVLWQTVVHNSYHIGQVAEVRRALGAWPPETGGDTW